MRGYAASCLRQGYKSTSFAHPSSAECNRNSIRHTPREYAGHRPHLASLSCVCAKAQTSARFAVRPLPTTSYDLAGALSSLTASPHGGSSRTLTRGLGESLLPWKPSPVGGRWMHEVQTNEGLGDFGFLSEAKIKSKSLLTPHQSEQVRTASPPRGKLKGTPPICFAKNCCHGNLPPWGEGGNGKAVDE